MKVLVFKLNNLGDNVVFLPVVQTLRARHPDWEITIITTPREAELYAAVLPPKRILPAGKMAFDKAWQRPWKLAAWWWRVRRLRPDACLVSFDQANVSHFLARHSGAGVRVGGNLQHIRFRGTLTHEVPMPDSQAVVAWHWEMARTLVRALGAGDWPETVPAPDLHHLVGPVAKTRPRVVVHAGSSREFTRWPVPKFAEVAARLARTHEVVWVERPETAGVTLPPDIRRAPCATLRELASVLAGADLFLGNNSGPMHLAIALGRPGVVVVGPSARGWDPHWHPERWELLRHPRLPCQPCELPNKMTLACANQAEPMACFQFWTVDAVESACRRMLARGQA